jgi:hypothetical protein
MWRETRRSRKPIPKKLWEAAAALCDDYTINQISKALRLNHTVLKKHIQSIKSGYLSETVSQPTFICQHDISCHCTTPFSYLSLNASLKATSH